MLTKAKKNNALLTIHEEGKLNLSIEKLRSLNTWIALQLVPGITKRNNSCGNRIPTYNCGSLEVVFVRSTLNFTALEKSLKRTSKGILSVLNSSQFRVNVNMTHVTFARRNERFMLHDNQLY